jgi:hypothetical protein
MLKKSLALFFIGAVFASPAQAALCNGEWWIDNSIPSYTLYQKPKLFTPYFKLEKSLFGKLTGDVDPPKFIFCRIDFEDGQTAFIRENEIIGLYPKIMRKVEKLPLLEKEKKLLEIQKQENSLQESKYIKTGSIGRQKSISSISSAPVYRSLEMLVGERIIFLPKRLSMQHYGYQSFSGGTGQFGHPTYAEAVGRIGLITKVSDNSYSGRITVQMEDNNQIYVGSGTDSIDGIAIVSEIDHARKEYLGKTLWLKRTYLETYNESKELSEETSFPKMVTIQDLKKADLDKIKLKKYSPVKVIDVVAGWNNDNPIRFILRTNSGQEGYDDVTITGSNVPSILRETFTFESTFLLYDPRKMNKWSKKVWNAIESEKVFVGMTADQAKLSWGEPEVINKTTTGKMRLEQWVYRSGNYLYFENGVLRAIQN